MTDEYEPEFHSYNTENLENSNFKSPTGKILGRTKPTIVTTHMCKLFCRGAECKYCKPENKFSGENMVIDGLYSSWITPNILAMARPSTANINQFAIVDQFIKMGIKTVINMQKPGEHNFCGYPLDESGFSYDPYVFMNNGIDYFNFPCDDFGVLRVEYLLDITKIIQHQLTRGKITVHCHAGLGRTGLVIACYLIFNNRLDEIEAINYVRSKRRNSIQNTVQVNKIIEFSLYLIPFRCVIWTTTCNLYKFSLQEAVLRQKKLVHGKESYILHFIPKILYLCLRKISQIAQEVEKSESDLFDNQETSSNENSLSGDSITTRNPQQKIKFTIWNNFMRWNKTIKHYFNKSISKDNANKILDCFCTQYENLTELDCIKKELNTTDEAWKRLYQIDDIHLHCQIVMDYLEVLKFPVLRSLDIEMLNTDYEDDPSSILLRLETCVGRTLAVFLAFINQCKFLDSSKLWQLRSLIFSKLTHKNICFGINDFDQGVSDLYHLDLSPALTECLKRFLELA